MGVFLWCISFVNNNNNNNSFIIIIIIVIFEINAKSVFNENRRLMSFLFVQSFSLFILPYLIVWLKKY